MTLKTETNTPEMEERVLDAANASALGDSHKHGLASAFAHGQWWVTCVDCGAQWSVVDATGGNSVDGFDFERVTEGYGYCEDPK